MRSTSIPRLAVLVLLALVLGSGSALAQATGTIQGIVTDTQGSGVPGATITARNTETDVSRALVSEPDGNYRFLNMPVGNYELTVELTGFSRYHRAGLTLAVNQTAVVAWSCGWRPSADSSKSVPTRRSSIRPTRRWASASTRDAWRSCR